MQSSSMSHLYVQCCKDRLFTDIDIYQDRTLPQHLFYHLDILMEHLALADSQSDPSFWTCFSYFAPPQYSLPFPFMHLPPPLIIYILTHIPSQLLHLDSIFVTLVIQFLSHTYFGYILPLIILILMAHSSIY